MIGKLTGVIDSIKQESIILDIDGVGYLVYTHNYILSESSVGDRISLYIETMVKEQDISLFGFNTEDEKKWFKNLISVQGVGAKLAIVILSALKINELKSVIITEDKSRIQSISGVGSKIATRIFSELKNKIKTVGETSSINVRLNRFNHIDANQRQVLDDAVGALIGLGFSKSDAIKKVTNISINYKDVTPEFLIKKVLKSNIL